MEKLRSIQVLRGIAACAVVVLHAYPEVLVEGGHRVRTIGLFGYGAFGVDLFFVISGFIMARVAPTRSAGAFISERLWRIYPLWWIAVLPWLLLVPPGSAGQASSLTLWPIYPSGYVMPVLRVGWTLSFELLFYLGMAVAIRTRAWVPLAAYTTFLLGAVTRSGPLLSFLGSPMALEFLMGVLVASAPRERRFGILILVGVALLALTGRATGDVLSTQAPTFAAWRVLTWGVPAALIVWGSLSLEETFQHPRFNMAVALGDASYSIYLFHPIIAYGFDLPPIARVLAAIAVGWMVHVVIERRLIAAGRRAPTFGLRSRGSPFPWRTPQGSPFAD